MTKEYALNKNISFFFEGKDDFVALRPNKNNVYRIWANNIRIFLKNLNLKFEVQDSTDKK